MIYPFPFFRLSPNFPHYFWPLPALKYAGLVLYHHYALSLMVFYCYIIPFVVFHCFWVCKRVIRANLSCMPLHLSFYLFFHAGSLGYPMLPLACNSGMPAILQVFLFKFWPSLNIHEKLQFNDFSLIVLATALPYHISII